VQANQLQLGLAQVWEPILNLPKEKSKRRRLKTQLGWRKILLRAGTTVIVLVVLAGGTLFAKGYLKARKVLKGGGNAVALKADADPSLLKVEGDGRINVMLLGRGGAGHDGPDLTDTILIASIDPIHKEAGLVSVPRDLWVKPPGSSGYTKINAVYANAKDKVLATNRTSNKEKAAEEAGLNAIQQNLQQVLGVPIHYRVMVDFEAFRKAIDTVGGVDINVKQQLYDPTVAWENNWNPLIAAVGQQHFDGKKALLYARSRHGSARGDFDRSERQREIILALKDKVLSVGTFSNPLKISQLIDAFGDHVQANFKLDEIRRLYEIGKNIPSTSVKSIGLVDPPHDYLTTGNVSGQSVVLPKAGVGNYLAVQSYLRNTLKDSYLKDENASVVIFNGTNTAGLATKRSDELKSYGYNVDKVADAPTKNYNKTILVDMRGGAKKYTKHYLELRLGVTTTTKLPAGIDAGTADFVIITGNNEAQ
jgi:LCP family protein required for cell wall assembly